MGDPQVWAQEGGVLGLIVLALFIYIVFLHKEHRLERKEWREDATKREESTLTTINRLEAAFQRLLESVHGRNN